MIHNKTSNYLKYENKNSLQKLLINKFLKNIDYLFKKTKSQYVLDAGCGEGFVTYYLRQNNPQSCFVGIDKNKEALLVFEKKNPQCKKIIADINNLPFAKNEFDLVLATEVLEHLERPEKALSEIYRVSEKYCLLSVPHEPFFRASNFLRGKNIKRFGSDLDHKNHWNQKTFVRLIKQYFTSIRVIHSFPWIIILGQKNKK